MLDNLNKKMAEEEIEHEIREQVNMNMGILKSALYSDVIWDEIVELNYLQDPKEFVYDFTVPGNDSFMVDENILVHNTLNTFHQAGVASKSSVTRGVPRLRELLKVTKNPKATSLTMYLKPEFRQNKEKAREVVQDLELTLLKNITKKVAIYWDPNEGSSVIEEDRELLEFYRLFEQGMTENEIQTPDSDTSKWVLRLELNREEMFNRNISMQDIAFVINNAFSNEINVVYSDYNSQKLVMRIRLDGLKENTKTREQAREQALDDFTKLKKFQTKLLNSIVIRGIPGIKAVTFRKDKQKVIMQDGKYEELEQYILDTDGTNFVKVMNHPAIDGTKLYSTNVHDVFEVLGTEATREILYSEIAGLFSSVGVNYRHLGLLCDVMTRSGKLMSIDRYGINKNDIGPLAKASFEETGKIMLKASMFGEVDPVTGVSANIMVGQTIRGGTAFSQILLDEAAMMQLYKDTEVDEDEQEETSNIIDLLEEGTRLNDPCATSNFQMNMTMPKASVVIEEEDVEVNIIE
jgi:DNA-directed RNA polymerase II subunit RPB1